MTHDDFKKFEYWWYKDLFNHDELEHIGNIAQQYGLPEEPSSQCNGKDTESFWCHDFKDVPLLEDFKNRSIAQAKSNFGYDIDLSLTTSFLLNIYQPSSAGYPWHMDSDPEPYHDIKMTCIINASTQPYQGGEFYLAHSGFPEEPLPELEAPGSAIVFRSNTIHRVAPIISGQRRSIVMFFKGPNWR